MTEIEIKRFIDEDITSDLKRQAQKGEAYYNGEHDILQYRMFYYNADGQLVEDRARANSRICHPFFTELVDQLAAYMLSFKENPFKAVHTAEGLQEHLDTYFDDTFWGEIQELITGAYSKGFEYLYAYKNADDRLAFECADSIGVVEVRAKDTDDNCEYIIYWYVDRMAKDRTPIKRIQIHNATETWFYVQKGDGEIKLDEEKKNNPLPNYVWKKEGVKYGRGLGFIPYWRLDYNKRRRSGLFPIKGLIDDYDLMECGLSNNLQDFDTPIHLVKGYQGDDLNELQQNIKTKKILGTDPDGDLSVLTVDIPYEARKTKADEDEKNIYRFGMGLNTQSLKDTNATTNIAIKMAYTLLELKAGKMTKRLKAFFKPILCAVLNEINEKNGTDYQYNDVKIDLTPNIQINEKEIVEIKKIEAETEQIKINTILSVAMSIGDEQVLRAICEVMDWDFDELKGQIEKLNEVQKTVTAQNLLNKVETTEVEM